MPGVRSGSMLNKKPIFSSESDFQGINNKTNGLKTEVRSENEATLRNGHARGVYGVSERCESQSAMNWKDRERKYTKIGKNGYNTKELAEQLRYLSVDSDSPNKVSSGCCEATVVKANTYAGRRDVSDPSTLQEKQIVSSRGTVRGFKNRVRAGIATFLQNQADETLVSSPALKNRYKFKGQSYTKGINMSCFN